ncbi:MAG: hypothetical protein GX490_06390 [Bacilli bacterium]|nr:hypothetical protein [Bacilli bacterium]
MSFIIYLLAFLFVLGLVIIVHEFGHFVFARRAGILCHEFSIGMGPVLFKIKKGETVYCIRAIPIGGYVSMAGEDPDIAKIKRNQRVYLKIQNNYVTDIYLYPDVKERLVQARVIDFDLYGKEGNDLYIHYENVDGESHYVKVKRDALYHFTKDNSQQIAPYDRCFESKRWLPRFLTVVMGAGFNFLLALVIFIVINLVTGAPRTEPIIGYVSPNSPAYNIGLQAGDKILTLQLEGEIPVEIKKWDDISSVMRRFSQGELTIKVLRDGQELTYTVIPEIYVATLGITSTRDLNNTIIGSVSANSNADKEGLQAGDEIIKISGTLNDDKNTDEVESGKLEISKAANTLTNWYDLNNFLRRFYLAEKLEITVLRNGEEKTFTVQTLKAIESANVSRAIVGITQDTNHNFFVAIGNGFKDTFSAIGSVFETLKLLVSDGNVGVGDLSGPVGIFDMTKTYAAAGFIALLSWLAFISANIGFVNLLPLPALDGGRIIFLFIEAIVRKPVDRKIEGIIHTVGFVLFMLLFVYVTFNDIIRIRG